MLNLVDLLVFFDFEEDAIPRYNSLEEAGVNMGAMDS